MRTKPGTVLRPCYGNVSSDGEVKLGGRYYIDGIEVSFRGGGEIDPSHKYYIEEHKTIISSPLIPEKYAVVCDCMAYPYDDNKKFRHASRPSRTPLELADSNWVTGTLA